MKKLSFIFLTLLILSFSGCNSATVERRETKPIDFYNSDFNRQKMISFIGIDAPHMSNYTSESGNSSDDMKIDFGIRYIKGISECVIVYN